MSQVVDKWERHQNEGDCKLASGAVCSFCHGQLKATAEYIVHVRRTENMPASGFYYYHVGHEPMQHGGADDPCQ
jgi:hypothetical protein